MQFKINTSLNFQKMYLELFTTYNIVKDKLIYQENDTILSNETPIQILNYSDKLNWQDAGTKITFLSTIFTFQIKYIFTTLKNIPFTPMHNIISSLNFKIKKLNTKIEGNYHSVMYGKIDNINKIKEYKNINFYNSFSFNPNLTLSLKIYNLLNFSNEKKYKYPDNSRKILFEINVLY